MVVSQTDGHVRSVRGPRRKATIVVHGGNASANPLVAMRGHLGSPGNGHFAGWVSYVTMVACAMLLHPGFVIVGREIPQQGEGFPIELWHSADKHLAGINATQGGMNSDAPWPVRGTLWPHAPHSSAGSTASCMDLELVSFKTCPYVQRSRITMLHKGVAHDVTYIDLQNPPAWFAAKSPLGKVPILLVKNGDKEDVLFESAVINEFVDEVSADKGRLMPEDLVLRAQTRAWIEFGSNCLTDFYQASVAKDEASHKAHVDELNRKLARLDEQVVGPFFLGNAFTLADAALAPMLMRFDWFEKHAEFTLSTFPKLSAWRDTLLALPAVENSIVADWEALQNGYLVRAGSWLGGRIEASGAKVATSFA